MIIQIFVGFLLGPSFLKVISYDHSLEFLAHISVIILLFIVGLEFKIHEIFDKRYALIAAAGVIVPWVGGFLTAVCFNVNVNGAVFTGTALTATSIAITVKTLKDMGLLQTGAAKAIIGAAVIDDVLGLLALSVSNEAVQGKVMSAAAVLVPLVCAGIFIIAGIYLGKHIISAGMGRILSRVHPVVSAAVALAAAFAYAYGAGLAHLSGIVGAFIAGLVLEGAFENKYGVRVMALLEGINRAMAPVFFISLGVLVDTHLIKPGVVVFMLALTAVAFASKLAGCFAAARWQGLPKQDALLVGIGMAPRGEVAMIVALIGLNQQLISPDVYAALIGMSVLTTVMTPLFFKLAASRSHS